MGTAGLTVDFADVNLTIRFDTVTGTVRLGTQEVTAGASALRPAATHDSKDSGLDATSAE